MDAPTFIVNEDGPVIRYSDIRTEHCSIKAVSPTMEAITYLERRGELRGQKSSDEIIDRGQA